MLKLKQEREMNNNMYVNYGDVDFFQYGLLIDTDHKENEINILYCRPYCDEENLFKFADCSVDITDNWIDKKGVMEFIGMNEDTFEPIWFAQGCIEYYGVENFSSPYDGYNFTREEIEKKLKYYLISSDNLNITW